MTIRPKPTDGYLTSNFKQHGNPLLTITVTPRVSCVDKDFGTYRLGYNGYAVQCEVLSLQNKIFLVFNHKVQRAVIPA